MRLSTVWVSLISKTAAHCQRQQNLPRKTLAHFISTLLYNNNTSSSPLSSPQKQATSYTELTILNPVIDPTSCAPCPSPPTAILWAPNWEDCGLIAKNEPIRMSSSPQEWNCMLAVELVKPQLLVASWEQEHTNTHQTYSTVTQITVYTPLKITECKFYVAHLRKVHNITVKESVVNHSRLPPQPYKWTGWGQIKQGLQGDRFTIKEGSKIARI